MCSSTTLSCGKRSSSGPSTSSRNAFSRSNTSIAGSVDFAVHQQRQADLLHLLERVEAARDARHARVRMGGGARRVELDAEHAAGKLGARDLLGRRVVGEVQRHQRLERRALRQRGEDALAVVQRLLAWCAPAGLRFGITMARPKRRAVSASTEAMRRAVAQVQVPVVGALERELVHPAEFYLARASALRYSSLRGAPVMRAASFAASLGGSASSRTSSTRVGIDGGGAVRRPGRAPARTRPAARCGLRRRASRRASPSGSRATSSNFLVSSRAITISRVRSPKRAREVRERRRRCGAAPRRGRPARAARAPPAPCGARPRPSGRKPANRKRCGGEAGGREGGGGRVRPGQRAHADARAVRLLRPAARPDRRAPGVPASLTRATFLPSRSSDDQFSAARALVVLVQRDGARRDAVPREQRARWCACPRRRSGAPSAAPRWRAGWRRRGCRWAWRRRYSVPAVIGLGGRVNRGGGVFVKPAMNWSGARAEDLCARLLQGAGLRLVARNWRCRHGEIDLIAEEGGTLVFAEVRMRSGSGFGGAAESVTAAKRERLLAAARLYLSRRPEAPTAASTSSWSTATRAGWNGSAMRLASSAAALLLCMRGGSGAGASPSGCSCRARRSPGFATTPPPRCGRSCASATRSSCRASPTIRTMRTR